MRLDQMIELNKLCIDAGAVPRVFDWDKAARIIKDNDYKNVKAGLDEDWYATSDAILINGVPYMESNSFLMSNWATPIMIILDDDNDGDTAIPCWCYKTECEWDAYTQWPDSALQIFRAEE